MRINDWLSGLRSRFHVWRGCAPGRGSSKYRKRRRERTHVAAIVEQFADRTLLSE